jgi:hypothetical protein
MKQFYFGLSRGQVKAQALRNAKLTFLRSGSKLAHPRYWAAFVISGDSQSRIAAVLPWSAITAVCAAALFAMALLLIQRR